MKFKHAARCCMLLWVLVFPAHLVAGETLESVAKQAIEASRKHRSIESKLTLQIEMSTALQRAKSIGRGTYEQLSEGEVTKFRMDLKNSIVTESNHKLVESGQSSILVVCSGDSVYTLTENKEEKNAVKNISKPSQCFAISKAFFDALFRENYVRLLPDDKVDDKEVWVIESTPKQMIGGQPVKTVHYILKDCGLRVKTTGHNVDGAQVQVSMLSDIKFDTSIKPDRFVFKAPSGVRIIDISQSR